MTPPLSKTLLYLQGELHREDPALAQAKQLPAVGITLPTLLMKQGQLKSQVSTGRHESVWSSDGDTQASGAGLSGVLMASPHLRRSWCQNASPRVPSLLTHSSSGNKPSTRVPATTHRFSFLLSPHFVARDLT